MMNLNLNAETIELYSKQLKTPSFNRYEDVIRQLDHNQSYEQFLIELLKLESASRTESSQKRKMKAAKFPYIKPLMKWTLAAMSTYQKQPFTN